MMGHLEQFMSRLRLNRYDINYQEAGMNKRVLIVDDQPELRRLVKLTMELDGFEVFEAENGQRGIEMIRVVKPSVILMDAMMPGRLDGFQACEKVKSSNPEIIVVMLTARAQESDRKLADQVGADAYITKPFSPIMLLEMIGRLNSEG